jgi:heavy metal translocating P-type ATPase
MKTVKLQVDGMSCASCAKAVEKALAAVPGVEKASVNFVSKTAAVDVKTAAVAEQVLIDAVKRSGYNARLPMKNRDAEEDRAARLQLIKVIGTGALLFLGWLLGATKLVPSSISTTLVIVALVLAAWPIFFRAIKALFAKRLDADVLVGIAVIAASSVGEFIAAGEVAFIMLLGAQLEQYTIRRARRSLGSLLSLVPPTARVRRDGTEAEVAAAEVQVGDVVVVRAGERIPVDGVVHSGMASVNQAPVTGESMPVDKSEGDEVFVGTLAETGALIIEAKRVGEDTTLARIAQLVEQAHQREAPIQRTLDRAAGWLVPVMLTLSVLVFIFTHDTARAITVLIVACPCALILATPTAIMAAISRAARSGVLIKGGQYLEATARLHTIVFDKTGTLTNGLPEVTHVSRFDQHSEAELVQMAAVAEKMSGHPVARAIMRKATALGLATEDPTKFQAHHGRGVVAERNGQKLVVGQTGLMTDESVVMSDALHAHMDEHHEEGHTTIVVAHDGKICGTICVSDTVRLRADEAIRDLRGLGVEKVVMLTGDNQRVAMQIAGKLGLDEVKAEVLPEQKAQHIESLKRPGRTGVAMVGDGVNDAPALAVADVGIAMGVSGTDVAHEAADIALMADDLSKIAFAVGLSRHTLRIIKQGLLFALVYNVVMVTTAATGHLHMIGGAIAHQFSSVIVILNAMRLLRYR